MTSWTRRAPWAAAVCEEFSLVGVNGIDFVATRGIPYAIEVNPRWCASMELVERAFGLSVFGAHAAACRDGVLAGFRLGGRDGWTLSEGGGLRAS